MKSSRISWSYQRELSMISLELSTLSLVRRELPKGATPYGLGGAIGEANRGRVGGWEKNRYCVSQIFQQKGATVTCSAFFRVDGISSFYAGNHRTDKLDFVCFCKDTET